MLKHILLVFLGGGLGSVLRFLIMKSLNKTTFAFPLGTFSVNVAGSFLLGIILGYAIHSKNLNSTTNLLFGVGFCGGFTTFSTFAFENHALLRSGDFFHFFLYTISSLLLGLLGILAGIYCSRLF